MESTSVDSKVYRKQQVTEQDVQKAIFNTTSISKRWEVVIPNCYTKHDNECDLWCLRKSGLYDEIEVKVSKADFRIDERKTIMTENVNAKGWKDKWIDKSKREANVDGELANYFWYAFPKGLVDHDDVPEWAGIMEIDPDTMRAREIRMPKRLHGTKLTDLQKFKQTRKLHFRFWKMF